MCPAVSGAAPPAPLIYVHNVLHDWPSPATNMPVMHTVLTRKVFNHQYSLQLLYDTFSAFGMVIATPKIMRDPDTGASKGFGFVSFDGFEASDGAIEAMNGQYLCNRSACVLDH